MTVSSTVNSIQYQGNGTSTSFGFPYLFFAPGDLVVTLFDQVANAPVSPAPVLNGGGTYDYAVQGTLDPSSGEYLAGGTVVFNNAPIATYGVTLQRVLAATQQVALSDNSKFPASAVNGALDRLTLLMQQALAAEDLAITIPLTDPTSTVTVLPPAAARALQFLGFDGSGNAIAATPAGAGIPISSAMQPLVAATSAAAARSVLGLGIGKGLTADGNNVDVWLGGGLALSVSGNIIAAHGGQVVARTNDATGAGDTAALQAALANVPTTGGIILLTAGAYYWQPGAFSVSGINALRIIGAGPGATTVNIVGGTTGDILDIGAGQYCSVESLLLLGSAAAPMVAGYGIKFSGNCFGCWTKDIAMQYLCNGIDISSSTETRSRGTLSLRYMTGSAGVNFVGTSSVPSYRAIIEDIRTDNPYPNGSAGTVKSYAASTAFSQGDVMVNGGNIYQCMVAGTTAASGGGPVAVQFATNISDGGAAWRFVSSAALAWIVQDSYAETLVIDKAALLDGAYGLLTQDSVGSGYGVSAPQFTITTEIECDHNFYGGIMLDAGSGYQGSLAWAGSCLQGNGFTIGSAYAGEFLQGVLRAVGNWQHGALVNCPSLGGGIALLLAWGNSQESAGSYHGITIASNCTDFFILAAFAGAFHGVATQGWGVLLGTGSSDHYQICNVNAPGNLSGAVSDGGSGSNKAVANNNA